MSESEAIMRKLDAIQADIHSLKQRLQDGYLSEDDLASIRKAEREFRSGRTVRIA
jgi:hypothetical protein